MTISTFTSGLHQSHEASHKNLINTTAEQTSIRIGDTAKGGGSADRISTQQIWDLGDPDVGSAPLTKNAILDSIKFEFVPLVNGLANSHTIALLASDGHWDRSTQHALSPAQGSPPYSSASFVISPDFVGKSPGGIPIFDTQPDLTGAVGLASGALDAWHTFGTTARMPVGANLRSVTIRIQRLDVPLPSPPGLVVNVYSLTKNGRQYTVDELIGTTAARGYHEILFGSYGPVAFTLTEDITVTEETWLGFMIEGQWFDDQYFSTQRIQLPVRINPLVTGYLAGTDGSLLHASKRPAVQWANSLPNFYFYQNDTPFIYPASSTTELTTPHSRFFGTAMNKFAGAWTAGVARTYGSVGSGADEEFADLLTNAQAWIDRADFNPATGNSWFGMAMEIFNPDNIVGTYRGPSHPTSPSIKVIIDWHTIPPSSVRAGSRARSRVEAAASTAGDRVASDAETRSRVFAASQASNRVKTTRDNAGGRVRAPQSNARSSE